MINFTMSELIYSDIASKKGINNMPDVKSLDKLLELICYCLQPLRDKLKKPIIITSGYRSEKLNKLLGGKQNSQHLFGCAADFIVSDLNPKQIIDIIKNTSIEFDQLINEYDRWTHISYVKNKNRNQILYIK